MIVHKGSKKETTTPNTAVLWGQRVSIVSTVILILLMFSYLIMSIRNSSSLAEQTEIISGHPFEVVNSIGDIKLNISARSGCRDTVLRRTWQLPGMR